MPETHLEFRRLTFVTERDGVMVGCPEAESYALLPVDGAELLRRLADGMPVAEAADWYQAKFHELVDVADFVASLRDLGFITTGGQKGSAQQAVRYQTLGRMLFSPAAWTLYIVIVAASVAAMVHYPVLRPSPGHIFFVRSLVLVDLILVFTQIPTVLIHEGFHVLAGRRRGIPSRLGVNRRLYYLVAETHLDGLLSLPRRQRYLPFFAGMVADTVVFSVLILIAAGTMSRGGVPWPDRLALAVAYMVLLRLAWQLFIFLRTDPYYALTTALGCTDLAGAALAYLRGRAGRFSGRRWVRHAALNQERWSPRDRQFARPFALLIVIGSGFLLTFTAVAAVPVLLEFIRLLVSGIAHGTTGKARFWDSVAALALILLQLVILPLLGGRWAKSRRRQQVRQDPVPVKGTLP